MNTRKHALVWILTILLVLAPVSVALGATEGTSDGTATVTSAVPQVTNSDIFDMDETASVNDTAIDVNTEYRINCTVSDENNLYDLENVTYIIWDSSTTTEGGTDANEDHYTFAYLNDTDSWDEIGPDGAGDSHLIAANCSDPTDHAQTSGEFKLAFNLHKTGQKAATSTWNVKIKAYDASSSGSEQKIVFQVNFYLELTVDDTTHGWSGVAPGSNDNQIDQPGDADIDFTVTANANFDLQAKGSGDLATDGNAIQLGNVTIHKDTLASSVSLTTTYADIGGLANLPAGESQAYSCILWLDVPSGQPQGDYTYTLYIQGVDAAV